MTSELEFCAMCGARMYYTRLGGSLAGVRLPLIDIVMCKSCGHQVDLLHFHNAAIATTKIKLRGGKKPEFTDTVESLSLSDIGSKIDLFQKNGIEIGNKSDAIVESHLIELIGTKLRKGNWNARSVDAPSRIEDFKRRPLGQTINVDDFESFDFIELGWTHSSGSVVKLYYAVLETLVVGKGGIVSSVEEKKFYLKIYEVWLVDTQ